MHRTMKALKRDAQTLMLSLETAERRAAITHTPPGEKKPVPRHPEAVAEVKRLNGLIADIKAEIDALENGE